MAQDRLDPVLFLRGGTGTKRTERVQNYPEEEGRLWEDFKHGLILGSAGFVEKIRSLRAGAASHKEIPQQKKVQGSADLMEVVKQASVLVDRENEKYVPGHRVRGEAKEDRDLLVHALWEIGLFRNEEI